MSVIKKYCDDRPSPSRLLKVESAGAVLKHGNGPDECDIHGAREPILTQVGERFVLYYDGAGKDGWIACLATSDDLLNWELHGTALALGTGDAPDSGSASSPWMIEHNNKWHMFYLATQNVTSDKYKIPNVPYVTCKAESDSPTGPWEKRYDVVPFDTKPGTYYSDTASPGAIIQQGDEFLQYFSCSAFEEDTGVLKRTLGLAVTKDLNAPWVLADEPLLPLDEQIENSSIVYDPESELWLLFTNHIGIHYIDKESLETYCGERLLAEETTEEYTDAVWVYWSKDPKKWDPENKAVVVDEKSCDWCRRPIGMPTVTWFNGRLAILFDAYPGGVTHHLHRDIGLVWLDLDELRSTHGVYQKAKTLSSDQVDQTK